MRGGVDKRAMAALSAGHFATDFAGGALPALLPFLVVRFDLSYTLAGAVMLASQVSSSVVQPLFGLWSDRRGAIWLLPTGVALAGIGMGLAADAPSYALVLALVVVSGLGTAAYHPEGYKFAAYVSGRRRASGMSLFSIGGNLGFATGPLAATVLIAAFGTTGGLLIALPPLLVAAALVALSPYLLSFVPERRDAGVHEGQDRIGALALLLGVITCRSVAWFGLITFVPLWYVSLGHSASYGNRALAMMLLAGGIGTLVAGPLADRVGRRPVLMASVVATPVLILVFVLVGGALGLAALALVGVCVIGTFAVTGVISQEYMPRHIAMASGLVSGLSIGLGGVAAVALGGLADAVDLRAAFIACVVVAAVAIPLVALLPPTRRRAQLEPEPVPL